MHIANPNEGVVMHNIHTHIALFVIDTHFSISSLEIIDFSEIGLEYVSSFHQLYYILKHETLIKDFAGLVYLYICICIILFTDIFFVIILCIIAPLFLSPVEYEYTYMYAKRILSHVFGVFLFIICF